MTTLLLFSGALLVAVLVSERARKSILSTAVLFIGVGLVAGATHVVAAPGDELLRAMAELALVVSLFSDGVKIDVRELRGRGAVAPLRALLIGLPLNLLATALVARWLLHMPWLACGLVGTALCPTDPVFAGAIVGSEQVPARLRRLLNVESGLNDGLAVPVLVVLLGLASGHRASALDIVRELVVGAAIGAVVPVAAVWLYRRRVFGAATAFKPIFALSVLLLVWAAATIIDGNEFLAVFTAGVVLGNVSQKAREYWERPGESVSELVKLAALLLFGVAVARSSILSLGWVAAAFVAAVLFVARPVSIAVALFGARLDRREKLVTAWFGPRGFASVVFGLMIVSSAAPQASKIFDVVALVVVASIVLHSSTDWLVARTFRRPGRLLGRAVPGSQKA